MGETRSVRRRPPARSPEERQNQMISLAYDLVEERLRNGTATSQETTQFIKMGSVREQVELERLRRENELLRAKTENLSNAQHIEDMYRGAIAAMRSYSGSGEEEEEDDYYD